MLPEEDSAPDEPLPEELLLEELPEEEPDEALSLFPLSEEDEDVLPEVDSDAPLTVRVRVLLVTVQSL
mgnify:CR=1